MFALVGRDRPIGNRHRADPPADPLEPTPVDVPHLAPLQCSLFALDQPDAPSSASSDGRAASLAASLAQTVVRHQLDPCCWVDVAQNWFGGADDLLVTLLERLTWTCGRRLMYGTFHDEPRLSATTHVRDTVLPQTVIDLAAALSDHYLAERSCIRRSARSNPADDRFESIFCNYYRDGNDSVAWHADRVGRRQVDPLVAIACLGGPRPFRVRPMGGGTATTFMLGSGDLLVMGGAMQHHWEHAVPKVRQAPPRMSVTLRAGPGAERA